MGERTTERPGDAERPQESGAASPGRGGRMSRQRKRDAVLRPLRGEDLETVSRGLGVTAATLSGWQAAFLAGGEASLATRPAGGEEIESGRLKSPGMRCQTCSIPAVFPAKRGARPRGSSAR